MALLYLLEQIRTPFWNTVLGALTYLGDEIPFMVIMLVMYWCVDKKKGLYVMYTGFVATIVCQFLKMMLCVPRPFVRDPEFTIVENARAKANDYSFPSGHSQNAASTYGAVARTTGKKWLRVICCILIAVVAFSRLYLGVHTPWDVLAGLTIGIASVIFVWPLFRDMENHKKRTGILFIIAGVLAIALAVFAQCRASMGYGDPQYDAGTLKNVYTMVGAAVGVVAAYFVDTYHTHMEVEAPFWGQVLKVVLGFGCILVIRTVLKAPINALTGGAAYGHAIRYFIVSVFGGVVWPFTFPLWKKVGARK